MVWYTMNTIGRATDTTISTSLDGQMVTPTYTQNTNILRVIAIWYFANFDCAPFKLEHASHGFHWVIHQVLLRRPVQPGFKALPCQVLLPHNRCTILFIHRYKCKYIIYYVCSFIRIYMYTSHLHSFAYICWNTLYPPFAFKDLSNFKCAIKGVWRQVKQKPKLSWGDQERAVWIWESVGLTVWETRETSETSPIFNCRMESGKFKYFIKLREREEFWRSLIWRQSRTVQFGGQRLSCCWALEVLRRLLRLVKKAEAHRTHGFYLMFSYPLMLFTNFFLAPGRQYCTTQTSVFWSRHMYIYIYIYTYTYTYYSFCEHVATTLTACIKDWCQTKHAWAEKHLRQVRCHGTVGRGGHDGKCGCPSCMANPDDHTWAVYFVEVVLTFGYLGMHIWSSKKINWTAIHACNSALQTHACMHMYYFNHAIHGAWFDGATSGGQSCPEGGVWISH